MNSALTPTPELLPPPASLLRIQQNLGGMGAQALPGALLQEQEELENLGEKNYAIVML